jgi:hypothetical protein
MLLILDIKQWMRGGGAENGQYFDCGQNCSKREGRPKAAEW